MELKKFLTRFDSGTKIRIYGNLSCDVLYDGIILKFVQDDNLMDKYGEDIVYMDKCNIKNDILFIGLEK